LIGFVAEIMLDFVFTHLAFGSAFIFTAVIGAFITQLWLLVFTVLSNSICSIIYSRLESSKVIGTSHFNLISLFKLDYIFIAGFIFRFPGL